MRIVQVSIFAMYLYNYNNQNQNINNLLLSFWCTYLSFDILLGCIDVPSICPSPADLLGFSSAFFEAAFIIFFAISFPVRSPVAYAKFWIEFSKALFYPSIADFFALSKSFCPYLLLKFLLRFLCEG